MLPVALIEYNAITVNILSAASPLTSSLARSEVKEEGLNHTVQIVNSFVFSIMNVMTVHSGKMLTKGINSS